MVHMGQRNSYLLSLQERSVQILLKKKNTKIVNGELQMRKQRDMFWTFEKMHGENEEVVENHNHQANAR